MRVSWHGNAFLPLMALLIAGAWFTLWVWDHSPYGRYLDHGAWTQAGIAQSICRSLPAGEWLLPVGLYVGGWLLMSAAMMLPTTLPLLEIFRRTVCRRSDCGRLLVMLILGYLTVWAGFGVLAHFTDLLVHAGAQASVWLTFNGWALGAGVLALAGLFQFSSLKLRCLEACRTPMSFVVKHWRGEAAYRRAFTLGLDHGFHCVGCCWALMLLMFVVGTGSVGWMLALGAIMAMEKNLRWGHRLSAPLGMCLLAWAGTMAAGQLIAL